MRNQRRAALAFSLLLALPLAACSTADSEGDPKPDLNSVTQIPESWLQQTADGWESSDGYGLEYPVLSEGECLLAEKMPRILDKRAKITNVGWGSYANDTEGYRYICDFWRRDMYAGDLQIIQASNSADAQAAYDEFKNTPSTPEQDNTVETVTSGNLEVLVLTRWYPTNPQGYYSALYYDEDAQALFIIEINSLSKENFDALSPQDVADLLVGLMATAQ
ncbi:hypothetical protein [uncultured Gulosibacter sp.]|uniref:hypothetical protein n=1 Tax=uncultured Gulosibacter sp. TaxID=1339167 RepID=UPI00288B346B|nr:hypothetical protein [uncultured Gulosibacter sp.]